MDKKIKCILSGAVCAFLVFISFIGSYIAPYDPIENNAINSLAKPSIQHLFGCDKLGRDILSRILCGAKTSFSLTFLILMMVVVIGVFIGLVASFSHTYVDRILMRLVDMLLAFPDTIFAISFAGIMGASLFNSIFALGLLWWTKYAKITRTLVLEMKDKRFIQSARMHGASIFKIIFVYIFPNIISKLLVVCLQDVGSMMLTLSTLSFLGLASQPPFPEWGAMLYESKQYMQIAPWMMIFPGLVIFIVVFAFNLFADHIRDILDPKGE